MSRGTTAGRGTTAILAALVAELEGVSDLPREITDLLVEARDNINRRHATDRENGLKSRGRPKLYRFERNGDYVTALADGHVLAEWRVIYRDRLRQIGGLKNRYLSRASREFVRKENQWKP
jgi:hypothetical protein